MPQVATTIEFSDKDIRDMLKEAAERLLPAGNRGTCKIAVHDPDGATMSSLGAVVSFEGVQAKK